MIFTTAIPVWLNVTCGNGHHQDYQLGPQDQLSEDKQVDDFSCRECGTAEISKVNISGAANANMRTLEEVNAE